MLLAFSDRLAAQPAPNLVLTNVRQVLELGNDPARHSNVTARVRGQVTFALHNRTSLFFQDGSNGLFAIYRGAITNLAPGTWIELEGPPAAGPLAPYLNSVRLTVLGPGVVPEPWRAHSDQLVVGEHHARFVVVRGRVRDLTTSWGNFTLLLGDETRTFQAQIRVGKEFHLPHHWLDAEVEVRGVCWTATDARSRPYGFTLYAADTNFITLLQPGNADAFDRPLVPLHEVLALRTNRPARVRTQGVVTHFSTLGQFYIQDGDAVAQVLTLAPLNQADQDGESIPRSRPVALRAGDRVEVVGAPALNGSITSLGHAEYRRTGTGTLAAPRPVKVEELMAGQHHARLVRLTARVLDREAIRSGPLILERIILQTGDHVFTAAMDNPDSVALPLQKNGYAELTGLNIPQAGRWKTVHSFMLLLRDVRDIRPVPPPAWWERRETVQTVAISGGILLLAAVWIFGQRRHLLRLRASEREVAEREQAETGLRQALAAEKELHELKGSFVSMVSHEFRTPLEVILSSSNILDRYLDRLAPEKRAAQLRAIRKSVHRMNDLIDDVLLLGKFDASGLSCTPAPVDLAAFCRRVANEISSASAREGVIKVTVEGLEGEATADEGLLHHMLGNLLGNAVKYSPPGRRVDLLVTRAGVDAQFIVRDRGCGIPVADQARLFTAFYRGSNVGQTPGSGLGLVITKRCVELHGGTIACASEQDVGTTFTVTLPLFDGTRVFRRRATAALRTEGVAKN